MVDGCFTPEALRSRFPQESMALDAHEKARNPSSSVLKNISRRWILHLSHALFGQALEFKQAPGFNLPDAFFRDAFALADLF
jgi:hypothetical protein